MLGACRSEAARLRDAPSIQGEGRGLSRYLATPDAWSILLGIERGFVDPMSLQNLSGCGCGGKQDELVPVPFIQVGRCL
jgi:hypothetical protein